MNFRSLPHLNVFKQNAIEKSRVGKCESEFQQLCNIGSANL